MAEVLVRASRLTRSFGARIAVRDVSFTLGAGEIVALLGPNGAGKTTTLRMLAGLIPPSEGEITLLGTRLTTASSDGLRQHVGLLTESPGLWDRLTVRLNLVTYAHLFGLPRPAAAVDRALALVGLTSRGDDLAGTLSKGLRQRAALARALLHEPAIVLLDEPTAGLDPGSARQVRDLIAGLREQGRAVLVSTHNLAEAESLADCVAVLNTSLVALEAPGALRQHRQGLRVDIELEGPAQGWLSHLADQWHGQLTADGCVLTGVLAEADQIPDLVASVVRAGARVCRVSPAVRSLEDVYLSLVGDEEATR
ncbi:MAG: ABC transporter ATP-binding protein [Acidobacteriota bacterium]